MTEIITVDFTPPQKKAGSCQVAYYCGGELWTNPSPVAYGSTQEYKLKLGTVHGWNFYAISFWGGINESSDSPAQSNVAEVYLDGWSNGNGHFPFNGTPIEFVSSIYVNSSDNNHDDTCIYFTLNNNSSSAIYGGKVGLEVTFTNSTTQADQNQFFTSRDPEIKLSKEGYPS